MPAPDCRLGVDVGGTNTDAVIMDAADRVLAKAKVPGTADITSGIVAATWHRAAEVCGSDHKLASIHRLGGGATRQHSGSHQPRAHALAQPRYCVERARRNLAQHVNAMAQQLELVDQLLDRRARR